MLLTSSLNSTGNPGVLKSVCSKSPPLLSTLPSMSVSLGTSRIVGREIGATYGGDATSVHTTLFGLTI